MDIDIIENEMLIAIEEIKQNLTLEPGGIAATFQKETGACYQNQ